MSINCDDIYEHFKQGLLKYKMAICHQTAVNQTDSDLYFSKGQTNIYFPIVMNTLEELMTNLKIIITVHGLSAVVFTLAI